MVRPIALATTLKIGASIENMIDRLYMNKLGPWYSGEIDTAFTKAIGILDDAIKDSATNWKKG